MNLQSRDLRSEIEHDAFVERMVHAWEFVERRRGLVIGLVIVILVAVLAGVMLVKAGHKREAQAGVLVNRAVEHFQAGDYDRATPLLQRAVAELPRTVSGRDARYFLGMIALHEGRIVEARESLSAYLQADGGRGFLAAAAQGGLAACAEREERWDEAAQAWTRAALADEQDNFNAPQYLLSAALCWERAGRPDEALPLLERLIEKHPTSSRKTRAEVVLARVRAMP
jgi:tetratricopeptide (TPR) repeat protein